MLRVRPVLALGILALAGCGEDEPTVHPPDPQTDRTDDSQEAPPDPPPSATPRERPSDGATAASDMYEVQIAASGSFQPGQAGVVAVTLVPKGEWHVNQDYPTSLEVWGPDGLSFAEAASGGPRHAARLEKGSAAEFGDTRARFDVNVTPAANGEQWVGAQLNFVMCTETSCTAPLDAVVSFALPIAGS